MGSKLSNLREVYRNRTGNMERRLPDDQKHRTSSENSNKRNYQVSLVLDVNGNPQNCIINTDEDDENQYSQSIFDPNAGNNTLNDDKRFLPTLMATTYKIMNDPVALGQPIDNKLNSTDKSSAKSNKVGKKKSRSRLFFLTKDVSSKKKKKHWVLKFGCTRLKCGNASNRSHINKNSCSQNNISCVCTGYKRTEPFIVGVEMSSDDLSLVPLLQDNDDDDDVEDEEGTEIVSRGEFSEHRNSANGAAGTSAGGSGKSEPVIDLSKFNPEDYPIEDCDERARLERAREIAEGVDPPPGFSSKHHIEVVCPSELSLDNLTALFRSALSLSTLSQIDTPRPIHTQIDYIHCLVPDLLQITSCSFYWGKMDRFEAERLLENKPEGTFLLRDSAQEEYLFSVSFRKYGSSLHARIEQWNHRFSFDSHDPGVFASSTVCGLIEHYKDPTCCMFFEPMLTIPLHRTFPFSLQHLCRAVICNSITYDSINLLKLPKSLKSYLKEYHYKQRVRVKKFDTDH